MLQGQEDSTGKGEESGRVHNLYWICAGKKRGLDSEDVISVSHVVDDSSGC